MMSKYDVNSDDAEYEEINSGDTDIYKWVKNYCYEHNIDF